MVAGLKLYNVSSLVSKMEHEYTGELKPCPFCGHSPLRYNLIDSLHPTGMHWFKCPSLDERWFGEDIDYVHSHQNPLQLVLEREITEQGKYWQFSCLETEGGCGATLTGTSCEDVMTKWNTRV